MYFFLKYIVTLFYKKHRIKIVVSFLCESGPRIDKSLMINEYFSVRCVVDRRDDKKTVDANGYFDS